MRAPVLTSAPLPAALVLLAGCSGLRLETIALEGDPPARVQVLRDGAGRGRRPVILMLGSLDAKAPPAWAEGLLRDGYLLAAFTVDHPPDPDPARRPQWLVFDERFAHAYALGGVRAPVDAGRVIDYLVTRADVNPEKIGWLGSSTTGIAGIAAAAREPRLKVIVAFVSTGAYRAWLESWKTNGLWTGKTGQLWSETEKLLDEGDPIVHVKTLFPCAVLLVSGGEDKVVDARTARTFVEAARPYYAREPDRLRLAIYEGFGHNLPADLVTTHAEGWFRTYLHPTRPPPEPPGPPASLDESARRTEVNAAHHAEIITQEPRKAP